MGYENITLVGGARVTVDLSEPSKCKKCKKEIFWATTKNAKSMPITKDLSNNWISHFADCPYAKDFKKTIKAGAGDKLDEVNRQKERELW